MVCEPCKCEGRDGPSKQWEVRLRGDITILLTPRVFPMPIKEPLWTGCTSKNACSLHSLLPILRICRALVAGFNHRLPVLGTVSWLHCVAQFVCMLVKHAR